MVVATKRNTHTWKHDDLRGMIFSIFVKFAIQKCHFVWCAGLCFGAVVFVNQKIELCVQLNFVNFEIVECKDHKFEKNYMQNMFLA